MPLKKIEVGEPFPQRLPRGQEGLFPLLGGETVIAPIIFNTMHPADEKAFEESRLQIGARVVNHVSFLIFYWEGWGGVDGSMNPYQYEEQYRQQFIEGEGNLLQLVVVEGRDQTVRINRALSLQPALYETLRSGYSDCLDYHADKSEVNRAVGQVYQDYETPEALMKGAPEKQIFQPHE